MQKRTMIGAMLALAMSVGFTTAFAAEPAQRQQHTAEDIKNATPSGTISFEAEQFRLILGGSSGKGVLTYQGKTYPFTFKGVSVGGIGMTKNEGTGQVYFMNKLEDFAGRYSAIGAGATAGKGSNAGSFENDKGVYLSVRSKSEGLALSLGITSATVEFTK
jgi:hypothetical protein